MSGAGEALKNVFENVYLREFGSDVVIYENWNSPNMTSFETRGRKQQDRGRVVFEFRLGTNVITANVLQIKGSRDFWRVEDVEDEDKYGVLIKHIARVTKINQQGNPIQLNSEGKAIFNIGGSVYGLQYGGKNNTQSITLTNNPDFDNAISGLIQLIHLSSMTEDDKEEFQNELQAVNKLALKEKTPNALERAKLKLDYLKTSLDATDIAIKAAPLLTSLYHFFQSLPR
jgi:hypothetical protein